jgi:hypothetical protein
MAVGMLGLLPISSSNATTYVAVSIKFSDDLGNTPLESSYAVASSATGESISQANYKNNAFLLNVPQGSQVRFRLVFMFYKSDELKNISARTKVPYIELYSAGQLSFNKDAEIQISLKDLQTYKIEVNDAQLNPLKNSLISETLNISIPTQINGLSWNISQKQSIPGNEWWIFSQTGQYEVVYYSIPGIRVNFSYWENGSLRGPDTGASGQSSNFLIEDFSEMFFCLPINFDSSRSTNKKCFENVLQSKLAEKAILAKAAADKAAADKAAADKAAAMTKKSTVTCLKGKVSKKVTAVKPKCPTGYKIKK